MNYFSTFIHRIRAWSPAFALLCVAACGVSDSADSGENLEYNVNFVIEPEPPASSIVVEMSVDQPRGLLREISFPVHEHVELLGGDGELLTFDGRVHWQLPASGGTLRWRAQVHSERGDRTFDALLRANWGVFRMEDIIPRARARTLKGAASRTTMTFDLPPAWSVITEYSAIDDPVVVDRAERRFDQPTGWVAMGDLGVRRETIAGMRVVVAAPTEHGARRMDMLALLNWTLPELVAILPDALPRLTIVSAGAPMWRGGLSGPASFYIHADRPLISENATSALLHEVMHTALRVRPRSGFDWIAEGLAEYYSIELLRRGNAITAKRAGTAMQEQSEWGSKTDSLCGDASTAETTARAVTLFATLNRELTAASNGEASLDNVLPLLAGKAVDLDLLTQAAESVAGTTLDTLHIDNLPGCRTIP
jgi:hypothetical protein